MDHFINRRDEDSNCIYSGKVLSPTNEVVGIASLSSCNGGTFVKLKIIMSNNDTLN